MRGANQAVNEHFIVGEWYDTDNNTSNNGDNPNWIHDEGCEPLANYEMYNHYFSTWIPCSPILQSVESWDWCDFANSAKCTGNCDWLQ